MERQVYKVAENLSGYNKEKTEKNREYNKDDNYMQRKLHTSKNLKKLLFTTNSIIRAHYAPQK